jgi:hypothetical protein
MLTPTEISKSWQTHRTYVVKCIKKGCPTDSFENARLWRSAHTTQRATTSPVQIAKQLGEEKDDDSPEARAGRKEYYVNKRNGATLSKEPTDASLDDALFAAIYASEEAFRLLQEAMIEGKTSKIGGILSIHNKALEVRFRAEQSYREELERRRILIPLAEAQDIMRKGFDVIIARLMALPQNVAPRCNPQDPHRAMNLLEEAVAAIMEDARAAFAEPDLGTTGSQSKRNENP